MEEFSKNSKLIYTGALKLMFYKNVSPLTALTSTVAGILFLPNAERILGDVYLDYLNYKKELSAGNFEKFYGFFELAESSDKKRNKKLLEDMVKFKNEEYLNCIIAYRLVKEHFSVKDFEKYKKLIEMLEEDEG